MKYEKPDPGSRIIASRLFFRISSLAFSIRLFLSSREIGTTFLIDFRPGNLFLFFSSGLLKPTDPRVNAPLPAIAVLFKKSLRFIDIKSFL